MPAKKKLVFCKTKVNASNIKRESRDGVEHIIITSFTLPPDVVMNNVLYLSEEVDKSYETLEGTLAPIEHPEVNGQFISATSAQAIHNFHGGAWNEGVERIEDGRIKINKIINVQEALKSERGKRLLDRVAGLEDGSDARPIHTSVGVYLELETLEKVQANAAGDKYNSIARSMHFDHDAILLDSIGAATPKKGVGIGVNKEQLDVDFVTCGEFIEGIEKHINGEDLRTNAENELSFDEIHSKLHDQLNEGITDFDKKSWIIAVFDDTFIFETPGGEMFRSNYAIDDNGNLEIQDTRLPVERVVEFRPINQPPNEDNAMRDTIIAELAKMGITVNTEISDADLKAEYDKAMLAANAGSNDSVTGAGDPATVQANADLAATVTTQAAEIDALQTNAKARDDADLAVKIKQIQTNSKYKALNEPTLKAIHANDAESFESMYNDSITSYGLGSTTHIVDDAGDFAVNTKVEDLPE